MMGFSKYDTKEKKELRDFIYTALGRMNRYRKSYLDTEIKLRAAMQKLEALGVTYCLNNVGRVK